MIVGIATLSNEEQVLRLGYLDNDCGKIYQEMEYEVEL
jgi:hypothetical protein